MKLDGAKVLVIGGAGFIGSHVVEALLANSVREVVIYDNFTRGSRDNLAAALEDPRCSIFPGGGDIRDLDVLDEALKGCDGVFHLAAMWLLHCIDYPRTAFDVNIQGTFNVLEACVRHGVKRLVFSSSASVYGDAVETPMTEDHPFLNRNFYGATKISGEAMCRAFHERYGLPFVGLRYMNVYGPRQHETGAYTGVIPRLITQIRRGQAPVINGDGSQAYDFVHVSDVARANVLAMQCERSDRFYNIGTGQQTEIRNLWATIKRQTGSELDAEYVRYDADDARQLVQSRVGAVGRAADELGFVANVKLEDGLAGLIAG